MARQAVSVLRDVDIRGIPSGFHATRPAGTPVIIQQRMGGAFTAMTPTGGLVRIDAKDADALGPDFVEEARRYEEERVAAAQGPFDEEKVWRRSARSTTRRSPPTSSSSASSTSWSPSRWRAGTR